MCCGLGFVLIASTAASSLLNRFEWWWSIASVSAKALTARSVIAAATLAFSSVLFIVFSQSMLGVLVALFIFCLLYGVDFLDERIRFGATVALVDMVPFWLARSFAALVVYGSAASALMDLRDTVDAACGIGKMADMAVRAVSPVIHHPIVNGGPKRGGLLDRVLAGHSESASWTPTTASFDLDIEGRDVRVGVARVIPALVVNGCDISSHTVRYFLTEGSDQCFALLGAGFER